MGLTSKWNEENIGEFLTENNITTITQLRKTDLSLYQWINRHKLREKFFGEQGWERVTWSVEKIQKMIEENNINSMAELMKFDKRAANWVYRERFVDLFFKKYSNEKYTEKYTPEKLQRRMKAESNERGGRVYDFEKFKDELERWAKEENTRVIDQCWELHCITEYVNYKKEHPEYDQIKVS